MSRYSIISQRSVCYCAILYLFTLLSFPFYGHNFQLNSPTVAVHQRMKIGCFRWWTPQLCHPLDMCRLFPSWRCNTPAHHCTACSTRDSRLVRSVGYLQPGGKTCQVASHDTVNHSLTFVAPSGVHPQNVESYWNRIKHKFKKMKSCHREMLPWREQHSPTSHQACVEK